MCGFRPQNTKMYINKQISTGNAVLYIVSFSGLKPHIYCTNILILQNVKKYAHLKAQVFTPLLFKCK